MKEILVLYGIIHQQQEATSSNKQQQAATSSNKLQQTATNSNKQQQTATNSNKQPNKNIIIIHINNSVLHLYIFSP